MQDFSVIFDFNGTILFDTPLQFRAWNGLLEETRGRCINENDFLRNANGRTSEETIAYFWGKQISETERHHLMAEKRKRYRALCLQYPELFHLADGLPEVLDCLSQHDIPFTIATSSSPSSVDFYFTHLKLDRWFRRDAVICSDRDFPGKPAPDIYHIAAKQLHTPPARCIVLEDAVAGAYAARAAGIGFIVVIDPDNTGLIWVGNEVDCVIRNYAQFQFMLQNIWTEPQG